MYRQQIHVGQVYLSVFKLVVQCNKDAYYNTCTDTCSSADNLYSHGGRTLLKLAFNASLLVRVILAHSTAAR